MSNSHRHLPDSPRTLAELAVVLLALSVFAACVPNGTVRWEEDRTIPFSADDRAIAYRHKDSVFVARTRGDMHRRVFTAKPDTTLSSPHWAPGQRAVLFAVTDGKRDSSTGLLSYALWYWPAPEDIWTSDVQKSAGDSATLPSDWTPANPRFLTAARFRAEIQLKADALFAWHPDGNHVLFLDTDASGLQSVMSLNADNGMRTVASPIRAPSLAFSISPNGEWLTSATRKSDMGALWLGPIGSDETKWRSIEKSPAPPVVPEHRVEDAQHRGHSEFLYDLRPRLGSWSPDSRWLAHIRAPAAAQPADSSQPADSNPIRELVLTRIATDRPQRVLSMPEGQTTDLHWAPGERLLGMLSEKRLLLVDPESGTLTELSGALQVEQFLGWSKPGSNLAYLTLAEEFDRTVAIVPHGRIRWAPAQRHNLMVAQPNGTLPSRRFGLMNISSARWGNQSTKLSFWATHLPTVSHLPPGDPAAVLDLDEDAIRWYPTDVAEYAQVGNYYLLNREYADAVKFYTDALTHVPDGDEDRTLVARIRLWRGMSRLAAGEAVAARKDLEYFRGHILAPDLQVPDGWDAAVFRALSIDQIFLSTLLSMGQISLAVEEATRIIEQDRDARLIQGLCYLAMIDRATGQHELFTDGVVTRLVPHAMRSEQIPRESAEMLVAAYLRDALHPSNQRYLSARTKKRLADKLVELAQSMQDTHPQAAVRLSESAAVFYRESGKTALEMDALRTSAGM
ncbi:MAG: hypothetical protein GTO28_00225 [Gammaproteobacteria bacterium]|nr:hypothetical protein [Gammaproteobacteria bacterium]NIM71643.1 hypothetical protein [Gammaproteobacteria bacterium]NIO23383.1 hypothetical protein [Gammaproteobacteria bacterium]NIO64011.1 hypothetical protein [Gammaproteobacteria bacterium]NIP47100.1 hypothetical protein [Gammaproteobacteria bacterium]